MYAQVTVCLVMLAISVASILATQNEQLVLSQPKSSSVVGVSVLFAIAIGIIYLLAKNNHGTIAWILTLAPIAFAGILVYMFVYFTFILPGIIAKAGGHIALASASVAGTGWNHSY